MEVAHFVSSVGTEEVQVLGQGLGPTIKVSLVWRVVHGEGEPNNHPQPAPLAGIGESGGQCGVGRVVLVEVTRHHHPAPSLRNE